MMWSFFDLFLSCYLLIFVAFVLYTVKGPLRLNYKTLYSYFLIFFCCISIITYFFFLPDANTFNNSRFTDILAFIFFILTSLSLVFLFKNLQQGPLKEDVYLMLFFFIASSYCIFRTTDLGILYLIIELPRASGLCISR